MGGRAVNGMLFYLPVLFLLLATGPATAARIYTIDSESGETTVTEQGRDEEPAVEEKPAVCPEDEKEIRRLRAVIRGQQETIGRQQALISRLRAELRRKDNIIMGLHHLRRQGR